MIVLLLTLQLALAQDNPVSEQADFREAEAQALLSVAQRELDSGETELARAMLEAVLETHSDTAAAVDAQAALTALLAPAEDAREAEAQALLSVAQRELDSGDTEMARAMLEAVLETHGDTAAAVSAQAALAPLQDEAEASVATEGRVQLAISQAIVGGLVGALTPTFFEVDPRDGNPYVLGSLVGIGVGIGGSLLYTSKHTVTRGQAWTLALGEGLGLYHGILITSVVEHRDPTVDGGTVLLSGLAGGVTGAWIAAKKNPSAEDVALVNTAASWGTVSGFILMAMTESGGNAVVPVAVADIGVFTGILLAQKHEISSRRLSLINGAGVAGAVVGTLAALSMDDSASIGATILLGEAAGLGVGILSTRSMQRDHDSRVSLSAPQLTLTPEPDGSRSVAVRFLNGQF